MQPSGESKARARVVAYQGRREGRTYVHNLAEEGRCLTGNHKPALMNELERVQQRFVCDRQKFKKRDVADTAAQPSKHVSTTNGSHSPRHELTEGWNTKKQRTPTDQGDPASLPTSSWRCSAAAGRVGLNLGCQSYL